MLAAIINKYMYEGFALGANTIEIPPGGELNMDEKVQSTYHKSIETVRIFRGHFLEITIHIENQIN